MEETIQILIIKEHARNDELLKARKELNQFIIKELKARKYIIMHEKLTFIFLVDIFANLYYI